MGEVAERSHDARVGEGIFALGEAGPPGEGAQIAAIDVERGRVEGAALPEQCGEGVVDRPVLDAVHQDVGAGTDGGARRLELGGVNGDADPRRMRFLDDRADHGQMLFGTLAGKHDVPDLDEIGAARKLGANQSGASSEVPAAMIGGSATSLSTGGRQVEMSGPATATRGARGLAALRSRRSKFDIGPPTSATEVTPLAR